LLARPRLLGTGLRDRGRACGDRFHVRGIRYRAADRGRAGEQPGVAQHSREVRVPVEWRRAAPIPGIGMLDAGRLLPLVPRRVVLVEELGSIEAACALSVRQTIVRIKVPA